MTQLVDDSTTLRLKQRQGSLISGVVFSGVLFHYY